MSRLPYSWAAICLAVYSIVLTSAALANPRAAAFGSLPDIDEPQLSPDGKHLAAIQTLNGRPAIAVYETAALAQGRPVVIPSSDWLVRGIRWVKNDRLIVIISTTIKFPGRNNQHIRTAARFAAVKSDGSSGIILMDDGRAARASTGEFADLELDDPTHMAVPVYAMRSGREDLYRIDLTTGDDEQLATGSASTVNWIMNGGRIVARVDASDDARSEILKRFERGDFKNVGVYPLTPGRYRGILDMAAGRNAVARRTIVGNFDALTAIDLTDGKERPYLAAPGYDIASDIRDLWTEHVVGAIYLADKAETIYADPQWQALQSGLEAAFPNKQVQIVSTDLAGDTVIAEVQSPRLPPTYYVLDRASHAAAPIGSAYPDLAETDLGEMKPYPYTARDGLEIPAYITLPPGRAAKNLPAVVMPHGGPAARDYLHFDWWAQFLANRGYVVLQPNYRGSFGYGQAFTKAGRHEWGLKMQDDITDGVKKMIADGIVDPKRICIVGASYGGYAALAGAAFTPDLYACAVSVAGIGDLFHMAKLATQDVYKYSADYEDFSEALGNRDDDADRLKATSPALHADRIKAPILLIHGVNDTTVPIEQSELMAEALQSAGKPVQLVRLEGDDHYLALAASRIAVLQQTEAFLAAHIGR